MKTTFDAAYEVSTHYRLTEFDYACYSGAVWVKWLAQGHHSGIEEGQAQSVLGIFNPARPMTESFGQKLTSLTFRPPLPMLFISDN